MRGIRTPADIAARSGENLNATLGAADGVFYQTDLRRIEGTTADDLNDWIDLTAAVPQGADSTTLVFRLRNSLLETTLLYDVMLAPAGARSIDWLGTGHISTDIQMGLWYERRFGLHISVFRDGAYHEVARVADAGPIFWRDVAAVIPVQPERPRSASACRFWLITGASIGLASHRRSAGWNQGSSRFPKLPALRDAQITWLGKV